MKISKQARRDAKQLFRATQVDGLLDENRVRQAVDELLARKPRGYVAILIHLERLVKLEIARRTARVESVTPLDGPMEGSIKAELTRHYGPGLYFSFSLNPSLIGGMRVQVGSDVYDGSVKARLEELEHSFEIA
jgi:F-type H+-transporting ATPase subunit delta